MSSIFRMKNFIFFSMPPGDKLEKWPRFRFLHLLFICSLSWLQLISPRHDGPSLATLSAIGFPHLKAAPYFAWKEIFDIVNKERTTQLQAAGVCHRVTEGWLAWLDCEVASLSVEVLSGINRKSIKTGFKSW